MRMTNLFIPGAPFLWYVELVGHIWLVLVYSTVHICIYCQTCQTDTHCTIFFECTAFPLGSLEK